MRNWTTSKKLFVGISLILSASTAWFVYQDLSTKAKYLPTYDDGVLQVLDGAVVAELEDVGASGAPEPSEVQDVGLLDGCVDVSPGGGEDLDGPEGFEESGSEEEDVQEDGSEGMEAVKSKASLKVYGHRIKRMNQEVDAIQLDLDIILRDIRKQERIEEGQYK